MHFEGADRHALDDTAAAAGGTAAAAVVRRIFEAYVIGELHIHCTYTAHTLHIHCVCTACDVYAGVCTYTCICTCTACTGVLGGTQLFSACSKETLHSLAPLFRLEERGVADASIFGVGADPDACYILLLGSVRLLRGECVLATLHSHDAMRPQHAHTFFGEHGLLASTPHRASAITAGPCKLLMLRRCRHCGWKMQGQSFQSTSFARQMHRRCTVDAPLVHGRRNFAIFLELVPGAKEMLRQTAAMRTDHAT